MKLNGPFLAHQECRRFYSMKRSLILFLVASAGCATGQWVAVPAERPLNPAELASRSVTVSGDNAELRDAFAQALMSDGFHVVSHAPYHEELEVTVSTQGPMAIATLRSDGFFVDEERATGNDTAALAKALARSSAIADFVRNSGLPQQTNLSAQ
jgi:hypothetical protein